MSHNVSSMYNKSNSRDQEKIMTTIEGDEARSLTKMFFQDLKLNLRKKNFLFIKLNE